MAIQRKLRTIVVAVGMALAAPVVVAKTTGVATANANSSQMAGGSIDFAQGTVNSATVSNNVLQNAKGNIGVNIGAGSGNMQGNNTDIAYTNGSLTRHTSDVASVASMQWGNAFALSLSEGVTNTASAADNVLQNASGNIGVNVASGSANMQVNSTALTHSNGVLPGGVADATATSLQGMGPLGLAGTEGDNDSASLSNHVLQDASGNIGVNVAAGDQNMQGNALAVAYNNGGVTAYAGAASMQMAGLIGALTIAADNDATLSNHVLQNASGNIGVNVAAGVQNMQHNGLSVATANAVYPFSPTVTSGASVAAVNNAQSAGALAGSLNMGSDNDASLANHVLQNASGNIGVNAAAGTQNMQSNGVAMATGLTTESAGAATTTVGNAQAVGPLGGSLSLGGDDDAFLTNGVLQNASGNIAANVAAGADNMQANNVGYAFNHAGQSATSVIDNDQGTEGFDGDAALLSLTAYGNDHAYLNDHVLQNASGNIGVNAAAGQWNGQANNLAIATAAGAVNSTTTATAGIADNQASNMSLEWLPSVAFSVSGVMRASLSDKVLQNASGNIGVNVASGVQNVQANNTALAFGDGTGTGDMDGDNTGGPAVASITGRQLSGPYSMAANIGSTNSASVANDVLQNAAGKIGANVAAGVQNMQSNDLAYAFNQAGSNASASTEVSQVSLGAIATDQPVSFYTGGDMDSDNSVTVPVTNTAEVSNNVLQNASGDIGLNVAAGAANMQRNTLTIADAD